jgi:hypothetical protein
MICIMYSLMTLLPSGCTFSSFSKFISTMSSGPSERALVLGKVLAGDVIAPRSAIAARIERRLLSDTRSVLEYLSKKKTKREMNGWVVKRSTDGPLQFSENGGAER